MQPDFLTKGYKMHRKDWCRVCNKITDHVLHLRGQDGNVICYRLGCEFCLVSYRRKINNVKACGLKAEKEKEAVEALLNPSRVETMAISSWTFLVTHPNYLGWVA